MCAPRRYLACPAARRRQRLIAAVVVSLPVVGLAAAVALAWGRGVGPVDLALLGIGYIGCVLGVELGFHRQFSHTAFRTRPWVRAALGILGSMAAQGPVLFWVATHRRHHAYSDRAGDPHSPHAHEDGPLALVRGLWHAHVGWLFRGEVSDLATFAPDMLRDPLAMRLSRWYAAWLLAGLALPAVVGGLATGSWHGCLTGFIWGGLVRTLLVHHATWSVNSLCHRFGARPFDTRDESRNLAWLAPFSLGGSWHNNHHAFPAAAKNDIRWWQIDPCGAAVSLLEALGLAWDVRKRGTRASVGNALRGVPGSADDSDGKPGTTPGTPRRAFPTGQAGVIATRPAGRRVQVAAALVVVALPFLGAIAAGVLAARVGLGWFGPLALAAMYVPTMLGITVGFHRYFTHKSYDTSRPMELLLAVVGSMAAQGPILFWIATHRRHHAYSDKPGDPHSPHEHGEGFAGTLRGLWHAHIGWMFTHDATDMVHFSRDWLGDRTIFRIHRTYWLWVGLGLALPAAVGGLLFGIGGVIDGLLWGGLVRIFLVNHASWCVGSICHAFGGRPFATHDHSANNHLVAVLTFGEGLQNNHHAFPSSYSHAVRRGEPDFSARVIRLFARLGLVWDIKSPSPRALRDAQIHPVSSLENCHA